jgi:hypothetical protein
VPPVTKAIAPLTSRGIVLTHEPGNGVRAGSDSRRKPLLIECASWLPYDLVTLGAHSKAYLTRELEGAPE